MKRYLFTAEIKAAAGSQTFFIDAESREEAEANLEAGGGEIYTHDVEVIDLEVFEFSGETSLDDFGDFQPVKEQPHD